MNIKKICLSGICSSVLAITFCSKPVIKKPAPEELEKRFNVESNAGYIKTDFAKSVKFNMQIKSVKRISIKYSLPADSEFNDEEIRLSNWHKELEKALIRMGFLINDEKEKAEFLLEDEEKEEPGSDASIVIDRIVIKEVPCEYQVKVNDSAENSQTYNYKYFLVELNGKMILRNNDIIWTCNLVSSSFDLLKTSKKIEPQIYVKGTRDYRYSEKLSRWVDDKWNIEVNDNFSSFYDGKIDETFHKRELISHSIKKFFKTLAE